tara:strand:+ start:78069 stop:79337 length:1269 start_codon:yes stop_codon:yes gene_type:complete
MAFPTLTPVSQMSKSILPPTGTASEVAALLPLEVYSGSGQFLSGAADQVAFTYKKIGGDVLDIELKPGNVYANYQEAVLEYSYLVNLHQSKNILSDVLGQTTGTFDHEGQRITGPENANLKFPRVSFEYERRVSDAYSTAAGFGGTIPIYSASFDLVQGQQDYDLQSIISGSSASGEDPSGTPAPYAGIVGDKRVIVKKVYYKTPNAMWRFFGYFGGLNVVGNLNHYGQYTDDSTFEIIPTWQNKLQAMAYEDNIYTRLSHYSYELKDNKLRIFPTPAVFSDYNNMWVDFSVIPDAWVETGTTDTGISGINNMNTLPFDNLPYDNINAIGKQWIRRFALALSKETLAQIRGKFQTIPIPGESVTLNADALLSQAKEEQEKLKEELKTILDELTYVELSKKDAEKAESTNEVQKKVPLLIFQG